VEVPSHYRLQYSTDDIQRRVGELGEEITGWAREVYENSGQDVVGIPILRGGIFFFADLVRAINHSVETSPVRTWGYATETKSLHDKMAVDLQGLKPEGRSVLLVDDICDSGRTLLQLSKDLKDMGAVDVRAATLVRRDMDDTFFPDYVGFTYSGDEWFVGYGMEDDDRFRNLGDIYVMEKGS